MGLRFTCLAYSSGNFSAQALAAGDSAPGRTMFTQMPYWPHSLAAILVRPRSASLFSLKFGGAEGGMRFSSERAWPGNVTTGEP